MLTREQHENSTALIAALRSGDYKQGKGALAQVSGGKEYNCCLGVGCRLANLPVMDEAPASPYISFDFGGKMKCSMPDSDWFFDRYGISFSFQAELADYNDNDVPFKDIADKIQDWLESEEVK